MNIKRKRLAGIVLTAVFLLALSEGSVLGAMQSASYKIPTDSINVEGDIITSDGYKLNFTTGEVATGKLTGASYNIHAGYQRMQPGTITISSPSDIVFLAGLGGVSGGTREDTASWTVTTDSPGGYELYVSASTDPALQCVSGGCSVGSDTIADYTVAVAGTPDYTWSVATTDAEFGFTPEGTHSIAKYLDNGSACNTGAGETSSRCWYYFDTSNEKIASSGTPNHPSGTATTVRLRVESGASHITPGGTYRAVITATGTAL